METSDVIEILRSFKAKYADKYGIKTIGIFGSFARRQQKEASDIDVVVTLKEPDFFILVAIREELEKLTNYKVDVVNYRDSLRETFKNKIVREAIFV